MTDYAPDSLTEIIIAYGADGRELDPELSEIAALIVNDSSSFDSCDDEVIREYLKRGAILVEEVLRSQRSGR